MKVNQAIYLFLVNIAYLREEKNLLLRALEKLDIENKGKLTEEQVEKAYNKVVGISDQELKAVIESLKHQESDYIEIIGNFL